MASKFFTVRCNCPTPLAANPFTMLAKDGDAARERFFRRNGITGSDHPIEVIEGKLDDPEVEVDDTPDPDDEATTPEAKPAAKKAKAPAKKSEDVTDEQRSDQSGND